MTKDEFVGQLDRAGILLGRFPVSGAIVAALSQSLKRGDPAWWQAVSKAWAERAFVGWMESWTLFLTCLHFEALDDEKCPLVPYLPSCGGTAEADPTAALEKFLADPPKSFYENLKKGLRRSYSLPLTAWWITPAMLFFQRKRVLPYYVVQLDAGAGLDLAADGVTDVKHFDASLVSARIGLDPKPLLLEDLAERRWHTAGLLPDDVPGIQAMDKAADFVLETRRRDPAYVQLVQGTAAKAPAFMRANIPVDKDVGLMALSMGATAGMDDSSYDRFAADLAVTLEPWGNRGLWVEVETVRGELYSTTVQLRARRLDAGTWRQAIIARIDMGTLQNEFFGKAAEAFLKP